MMIAPLMRVAHRQGVIEVIERRKEKNHPRKRKERNQRKEEKRRAKSPRNEIEKGIRLKSAID